MKNDEKVKTGKSTRGRKTASELIAQLHNEPAYVRKAALAEFQRENQVEALRIAEQPVIDDLRKVGLEVDSVWDLVNISDPYPEALAVLIDHLERGGYPDRVMEGLARALAVKPSLTYWDRLRARYRVARGAGEEEGVAVALAACATKAQFEDLVSLLESPGRGDSRLHFLRPIRRVGGERGRALLQSLSGDSTFGREAVALLNRNA